MARQTAFHVKPNNIQRFSLDFLRFFNSVVCNKCTPTLKLRGHNELCSQGWPFLTSLCCVLTGHNTQALLWSITVLNRHTAVMIRHVTSHKSLILAHVLRMLDCTAVSFGGSCSFVCVVFSTPWVSTKCFVSSELHFTNNSKLNMVSEVPVIVIWAIECPWSDFKGKHKHYDLDIVLKYRRQQTLCQRHKTLNQLQYLQATFHHCHTLNYQVILSSTGGSGNRFGGPISLLLDLTSKTRNTLWLRSLLATG